MPLDPCICYDICTVKVVYPSNVQFRLCCFAESIPRVRFVSVFVFCCFIC